MLRTGYLTIAAAAGVLFVACAPPGPAESSKAESSKVEAPKVESPTATQLAESDPAAYRGAAVAAQVCSRCHDIGMGAPPAMEIGAPKFRDLAERADSTAESLGARMRDSHPIMPDYIFGDAEIAELAIYIIGLRGDPG